ncbi:Predicted arabinose efflux permease, MFS family [Micromonospora haikouensis]|uniref:Predicted arabinose efflux permease, MFS family n=1 Tax=Micromonospora haikouensis TaxID=686309 RepID=A0A1C4WJV9_9ACTN|nr:MFS transporter [Micromonospora haikouensis]SCE96423.1 Predicted arabinose efflux permease, MFS family [Micromonospora haikouensis]
MTSPRDVTRTVPFWLLFAASTLGAMTNSASTPIIPGYVERVLGGDASLSGVLISLSAVASMAAMPVAGMLGDRRGYRTVALAGGGTAALGMLLLAAVPSLWGAGPARLLFGLGNAAAMTLVMAWLVALAPTGQRGRALSVFGLSVWLGLAVGPQVGVAVNQAVGPAGVFALCAVLEVATVVLVAWLPRPARPPAAPHSRGAGAVRGSFRAVWVPGVVAAAAWCGEGLMLGFLLVHLQARGVRAGGVTGAASVFAVFSISVIGARIALAGLPDRIGPVRATAVSLCALAAGLVTMGLAPNFWVAAAAQVLIGIGFSPLYPSLTMLAARGLDGANQALGLGLFSSFTGLGNASGALVGGLVIAAASTGWAFLLVAALQVAALVVVAAFARETPPDRPGAAPGRPGAAPDPADGVPGPAAG